jgi:membrane dipeptidase
MNSSRLEWLALRTDAAAATQYDGSVEITGWMTPLDPAAQTADYFLLSADAPCCGGCITADPRSCIEVFAASPVAVSGDAVQIRGRLLRLVDDPAGWRYRLVEAVSLSPQATASQRSINRRSFLASGAALGLAACAPGRFAGYRDEAEKSGDAPQWQPSATTPSIDMHSHAGRVIVSRDPAIGANRPFLPLAAPMRAGGMNVICLAIVTDTTVTHVSADRKRFEAWRTPQKGELYALGQAEFARAHALIEREQMQVVTNTATLQAHAFAGPCAIIAAEGADFLEGNIDTLDEAHSQHGLRHLQLTHYRVNELGDIQTEPPVHGGLTDFGADVIRRCNSLGIVVDVAHGTYDLVRRAASTSTKPLVLSHTALATHPGARSRLISPDHARAIAGTGGVIGVWPSSGSFSDLHAMAEGVKRMADLVGVEHVGLGSDMLGFISPPVFRSYEQLPALGNALLSAGFTQDEVTQVLGANYLRVFTASVG